MAIVINKTKSTPYVKFENGVLEISGRAIPEHSIEFFKPLLAELEKYEKKPNTQTTVNFGLEYANSGAKRLLMDVCIVLERISKQDNSNVQITWACDEEDEHMRELGSDIQALVSVPFKFIYKK